VQALTDEQRKQLDIASGGVLITQVRPGPAAHAGIMPGDVVLKVGSKQSHRSRAVCLAGTRPTAWQAMAFLIQRQQGVYLWQ